MDQCEARLFAVGLAASRPECCTPPMAIVLYHHPYTRAANVVWMLEEVGVPWRRPRIGRSGKIALERVEQRPGHQRANAINAKVAEEHWIGS